MQSSKLKPMNSDEPKVNHYYQHFYGDIYRVSAIAHHTEWDQDLVIYENRHGQTWARPIKDWYKPTDNGQKRFSEVIVRSI